MHQQQFPKKSSPEIGQESGSAGGSVKTMPPSPKCAIYGVASVQESQDGFAPGTYLLQSAPNSKIPPRGDETFFERLNSVLYSATLHIHFGQVQVQLRVIVAHPQGFLAQRLRIREASFRERSEQTGIGKVKSVLRRNSERLPYVQQGILGMTIA